MTTRLDVWRLIRDRGPMHVDEICAEYPNRSKKAVLNRLSELANCEYPGLEISRLMRGIYIVKRAQ